MKNLIIIVILLISTIGYSQRVKQVGGLEFEIFEEVTVSENKYYKFKDPERKGEILLLILRADNKFIYFEQKDFSYSEFYYKTFKGIFKNGGIVNYLEMYNEESDTVFFLLGKIPNTNEAIWILENGKHYSLVSLSFDEAHEIVGSVNLHLIQTDRNKRKSIWDIIYGDLRITDLTKIALTEIDEGIKRGGGREISNTRVLKGEGTWYTNSSIECYGDYRGESFNKESVVTVMDRKSISSPYRVSSKWLIVHILDCSKNEFYTVYKNGKYVGKYSDYNSVYSKIAY